MNTRLNPSSIQPTPFYSHGMQIPAGASLVQTSGQVGVDVDGKVAEGVGAQGVQAITNVLAVLAEAGMGPEDIVLVRIYLTDAAHIGPFSAATASLLPSPPPATTMLVIKSLASPELLVEIEALAAR